jgi:hypothetical protein
MIFFCLVPDIYFQNEKVKITSPSMSNQAVAPKPSCSSTDVQDNNDEPRLGKNFNFL